jgi:hypothetical protein
MIWVRSMGATQKDVNKATLHNAMLHFEKLTLNLDVEWYDIGASKSATGIEWKETTGEIF